jgi:hypothetical protein
MAVLSPTAVKVPDGVGLERLRELVAVGCGLQGAGAARRGVHNVILRIRFL